VEISWKKFAPFFNMHLLVQRFLWSCLAIEPTYSDHESQVLIRTLNKACRQTSSR
jgi:hypothetical protein